MHSKEPSRLTLRRRQIRELQLSTSQPLGSTIQSLATAIASIIIAFRSSWSLTLILLGSMPINALVVSLISRRMQENIGNQASQLTIATKHSSNSFRNVETVKCFNGQQTEYDRFVTPIKRAAHFYIRQVRGNALQMGWMMFATFVAFLGGCKSRRFRRGPLWPSLRKVSEILCGHPTGVD